MTHRIHARRHVCVRVCIRPCFCTALSYKSSYTWAYCIQPRTQKITSIMAGFQESFVPFHPLSERRLAIRIQLVELHLQPSNHVVVREIDHFIVQLAKGLLACLRLDSTECWFPWLVGGGNGIVLIDDSAVLGCLFFVSHQSSVWLTISSMRSLVKLVWTRVMSTCVNSSLEPSQCAHEINKKWCDAFSPAGAELCCEVMYW